MYMPDRMNLIVNDMMKISTPLQTEYSFQFETPVAPDLPIKLVRDITTTVIEGKCIGVQDKILSTDSGIVVS